MKIAHVAIATPRMCGLYETTRELVKAERDLGVDARIVDPAPVPRYAPEGPEDRGVPIADMVWALDADLIASHSGHDGTPLSSTRQPILHVAHGRPISTFMGQREGGPPNYSYAVTRRLDSRYRGCVTFWPEHAEILRQLWHPKPVTVVPAPVDLDYWCPGETDYDFAGRAASFNVVMADPWSRTDAHPVLCVHAFARFREDWPESRLHIYGLDDNPRGMGALKAMLGEGLGVVQKWAADLRRVYRVADMLITPHRIATRSVREAMACNVRVVSGRNCNPEDTAEFAAQMVIAAAQAGLARKQAQIMFQPLASARKFLDVAESVMEAA